MQYSKSEERLSILKEMESEFDKKNVDYFRKVLKHDDYVIRTRAVCILADIAGSGFWPQKYHRFVTKARWISCIAPCTKYIPVY